MAVRRAAKMITGVLTVCVSMPIWYFLIYSILKAINADRLVWFLFWIYLPISMAVMVIDKIADKMIDEK